MVEIRRQLHQNPELSFEEIKTAQFIAEYHRKLGHEVRSDVGADSATLSGTVRTFKESVRQFLEKEIEKVVKGTCVISDADYQYEFRRGYPAVINHPEETNFIAEISKKVPGVNSVTEFEPKMGGEDFAYYLQHVKGTFFFTGASVSDPNEIYPHHHPKFNFDERGMLIAAQVLVSATLQYMNLKQFTANS